MSKTTLDQKREAIRNKIIIGIDPANEKHQGFIIDEYGIGVAKSFQFSNNHNGITKTLWYQLKKRLNSDKINPKNLVFAVEASIDFWQVMTDYLSRQGYQVALVNPFTTKKSRGLSNNDLSKTDPKDARLVAENTREGYFHWYRNHDTTQQKAMKTLSLTYDKLRKDLQSNQARLRSQIKRIFPEFLQTVTLNTKTALYLLSKYLYPEEYIAMDISIIATEIRKISYQQYNQDTLIELKQKAKNSIGIPKSSDEKIADKLTIQSLISMIKLLQQHQKQIQKELIKFAKEYSDFDSLTSLNGISDLTAALFLAEIQHSDKYNHFKQIEKLAGYNLRLNTSGQSTGYFKINKIGNSRLRWVIFQMTKETAKYIPEIRYKYLKRQLKHACYTKNITACTSQLLQLLFSLMKNKRTYQYREETERLLFDLEEEYYRKNKKYKTKKNKAIRHA
jgi:transposase